MTFDDNNLPKLGSKVFLVEEDKKTKRPLVRSGFVFAHMIRHNIGPLILIDTTSETADDMDQSDDDNWSGDPSFLYDSAGAAGRAIDINHK